MLTEYAEVVQGSDAWLEQRRGMVTASVVGRLITAKTLKPAANDYSRGLTAQLVAERISGWVDPNYVNDDMLRGIEDEPRAVEKYAEHYNAEVSTTGFMVRDDWGWRLGYSPDALVGDDGLLEIKCPRAKGHLATILGGEVPAQHMAQIQCGLLVSGRRWLDFVSYCGGLPMWVKRVEPDPAWHEAIVTAVEQFETTAVEMVGEYERAIKGLAQTERTVLEEMRI